MTFERIQLRRGTAQQWVEKNPILLQGEPGYETDTRKKKIGDGINTWASLPYDGASDSSATVDTFEYEMPVAQTTAVVDHTLGRDPVAIQVLSLDGELFSEFQVVVTVPSSQITLGFDIPVQALIRLL